MFRRRQDLPPRPQVPDVDQIIQDLQSVGNDDPIFDDVAEKSAEELEMIKKAKELVSWSQNLQDIYSKLMDIRESLLNSQIDVVSNVDILKSFAANCTMEENVQQLSPNKS